MYLRGHETHEEAKDYKNAKLLKHTDQRSAIIKVCNRKVLQTIQTRKFFDHGMLLLHS